MNKLPVIVCITIAGIAAICGKCAYDRRKTANASTVRAMPDTDQI